MFFYFRKKPAAYTAKKIASARCALAILFNFSDRHSYSAKPISASVMVKVHSR